MNAADRRRLSGVLMVAVVVSAAVWLLLLNGAGSSLRRDPPRPPPPLPPAASALPPTFAGAAADPAIWQHPLFWADRQSPAGGGDGAQGSSGELELTGVIMDGSLRVALLRDRASGKSFVLRPGTEVGRWRLLRLSPRGAVLAGSGGERLDLRLRSAVPAANPAPEDASSAATSTAVPAAVESWRNGRPAQTPASNGPVGQPPGQPVGPDHPSAIRPPAPPAESGSSNPAIAERLRALRQRLDDRRRQLQQNGGVSPRTTDNGAGS